MLAVTKIPRIIHLGNKDQYSWRRPHGPQKRMSYQDMYQNRFEVSGAPPGVDGVWLCHLERRGPAEVFLHPPWNHSHTVTSDEHLHNRE